MKLVPYATESSVTLTKKHRFKNATFSDYTTSFVGIKARFIADENYAPYEEGETGNGLILDMGDNPIVRGLPETKHAVLDAVFEVLKNVSYTPFEIETLGNPALDLGDMITNQAVGKDANTYISPITYSYWTYRGKHKLRAVGGNPKLSGVSNKQGKQISSLESGIDSKSVIVKNYSNADDISFSSEETELAYINYAATENSKLIFLMTVRLSVSLDGVLVIKFYTDAKADTERVFRKYLERGEHFVTISEIYTAETNDRRTISIKAHMEYFESDSRKQDADITTSKNFLAAIAETAPTVSDNIVTFPSYDVGVIDTTIATCTIAKNGVKAVLYGQGIAGEGKWDGTINFAENIDKIIDFTGGLMFNNNVTEILNVENQTPVASGFNVPLGSVEFRSVFGFDGSIKEDIRLGWNGAYTWYDVKDYWTWNDVKSKTWKDLRGAGE